MTIFAGEGAKLEVSTDGTAYTVIAQVVTIDPFDYSNEAVDTPSLARISKTNRAGLQPDYGTLSFSILYDPADASHIIIEGLLASPVESFWRFSDTEITPKTWTGSGTLTKFTITGIAEEENMGADVEVKLSGPMVEA